MEIVYTTKKKMLCQDCLAVADFDLAGHQEQYFCDCGGQWCGCDDCHDMAIDVLDGAAVRLPLRV